MKLKLAVLLSTVLTAGCIATEPLRDIAVDSNRLVSRSADEEALRNVIRASQRMPKHHFTFTILRGSTTFKGEASLGGSLPDSSSSTTTSTAAGAMQSSVSTTASRAVDTFSPSVGASVTATPGYEMKKHQGKEFQQGIMAPIKPSLVEYYLRQGWPEDLLTALFINNIEIQIEISNPDLASVEAVEAARLKKETPPRLKWKPVSKHVFSWDNHPYEDELVIQKVPPTGSKEAIKHQERFSTESGFGFGRLVSNTVMVPIKTTTAPKSLIPLDDLKAKSSLEEVSVLDGKTFDILEKEDSKTKESVAFVARSGSTQRKFALVTSNSGLINDLLRPITADLDNRKFDEFKITSDVNHDAHFESSAGPSESSSALLDDEAVRGEVFYFLELKEDTSAQQFDTMAAALKPLEDSATDIRNSIEEIHSSKDMTDLEKTAQIMLLNRRLTKIVDEIAVRKREFYCRLNVEYCRKIDVKYEVFTRSTESLLYFLGSYARAMMTGPDSEKPVYKIECSNPANQSTTPKKEHGYCDKDATAKSVIEIVKGPLPGALLATYDDHGQLYSLKPSSEKDPSTRGSQSITLLQQLINLNISADSLPSSQSVTLVPQ